MKTKVLLLGALISLSTMAQKPKVWIYTDMSDKTIPGNNAEGTVNDPDDISAMAGYMLMSNEFNTVGIVVASTHRSEHKTSGNQATWAKNYFGPAYAKDLPGLNANIGGYPDGFTFQQSCIKESAEKFSNSKTYANLSGYSTVKSLLDYVNGQSDIVNVLIWGSTTEPAIFVKHCLSNNKKDLLKKVRFIAHWTNSSIWQGTDAQPWKVANCNEDINACNYLKDRAYARDIDYYECGAIGQNGVMGGVSGETYFNQFRAGAVGTIFREGKYAHNKVDHSDAATYWVLLGGWGVNLSDINPNGTNPKATEKANSDKFGARSKDIHNELLRRAKAAVYTEPNDNKAPTAPANLTTSSITQTSFKLSWTASTDNVGVTGYDVYQGTTLKTSVTSTSASITGLTCNTSYSYNVKAKDAAGNVSAASTAKSVTTSACSSTNGPTDITDLTATAISCTSVKLTWSDVSGEETYRIRRKIAGAATFTNIADVPANTTTYTDNTALANTAYDYMVRPMVGGVAVKISNVPRITTPSCATNTTTRFEAESYSAMSGIQKQTTTDAGGGQNVAYINNNDWCDYTFKVVNAGTYATKFRVASVQNGGTIQILKGTTVLGSVNVATTGGWQTWKTINGPDINLTSTGTQTIRLKFVNTSSGGFLMNLNWFEITGGGSLKKALGENADTEITNVSFEVYPNPSNGQFTIDLSHVNESSLIEVYNMQGALVHTQMSEPAELEVQTTNWNSGMYFIVVRTAGTSIGKKIIVN